MLKKFTIKELDQQGEMVKAYSLISQMYPKMSLEDFRKNVEEMSKMNNYKMVAIFDDEKMVGVSGYWLLRMLYCGRYIQLSNFVVDENSRNRGIGKMLLDHFTTMAKESGCEKIILDSYTENKQSHSLYYREGFYIRGLHFMKDVNNG